MPIVETNLDDYLPGGKYYDPARDPVEQRLVGAGKGRFRERKKLPCPDDAKAIAERDRWEAEMQKAVLEFAWAMRRLGRGKEIETYGLLSPEKCCKVCIHTLYLAGHTDDNSPKYIKDPVWFLRATELLNAKSL